MSSFEDILCFAEDYEKGHCTRAEAIQTMISRSSSVDLEELWPKLPPWVCRDILLYADETELADTAPGIPVFVSQAASDHFEAAIRRIKVWLLSLPASDPAAPG
jgi:hypothetical protein